MTQSLCSCLLMLVLGCHNSCSTRLLLVGDRREEAGRTSLGKASTISAFPHDYDNVRHGTPIFCMVAWQSRPWATQRKWNACLHTKHCVNYGTAAFLISELYHGFSDGSSLRWESQKFWFSRTTITAHATRPHAHTHHARTRLDWDWPTRRERERESDFRDE